MGDMGDDFRALREHQRERKAAMMPDRINAILALRQAGHTVKVISEGWHYRIDGRIDLYPVRRRWHDLRRNVRGWYEDPTTIVGKLVARGQAGR